MGGVQNEKVALGGSKREGWHTAYRGASGELVVEWLEYCDPAPYDHATSIAFAPDQELALMAALAPEGSAVSTLALLSLTFNTYWAVREFADSHQIGYDRRVDFNP